MRSQVLIRHLVGIRIELFVAGIARVLLRMRIIEDTISIVRMQVGAKGSGCFSFPE